MSAAPQARSWAPTNGWCGVAEDLRRQRGVRRPRTGSSWPIVADADREQQRRGLAGGPGDGEQAPLTMPGSAAGSTTVRIVRHLLAPSA